MFPITTIEDAFRLCAELGIGCSETAQSAAVASLAPGRLRGSAFGLLATVQSAGNLIASAAAGVLWGAVSPEAAFIFLAAAMAIAAALIPAVGGIFIWPQIGDQRQRSLATAGPLDHEHFRGCLRPDRRQRLPRAPAR